MKAALLALLAAFAMSLPVFAEDEAPGAAPIDPNMPAAETQPPAPSEAPVHKAHKAKKKSSKHGKKSAKGKKKGKKSKKKKARHHSSQQY